MSIVCHCPAYTGTYSKCQTPLSRHIVTELKSVPCLAVVLQEQCSNFKISFFFSSSFSYSSTASSTAAALPLLFLVIIYYNNSGHDPPRQRRRNMSMPRQALGEGNDSRLIEAVMTGCRFRCHQPLVGSRRMCCLSHESSDVFALTFHDDDFSQSVCLH